MEMASGQAFGDVRLHTGPAAAELAATHYADALTVGQDVVFAAG